MYLRNKPQRTGLAITAASVIGVVVFAGLLKTLPFVIPASSGFMGVTYSPAALAWRVWSGALLVSSFVGVLVFHLVHEK